MHSNAGIIADSVEGCPEQRLGVHTGSQTLVSLSSLTPSLWDLGNKACTWKHFPIVTEGKGHVLLSHGGCSNKIKAQLAAEHSA